MAQIENKAMAMVFGFERSINTDSKEKSTPKIRSPSIDFEEACTVCVINVRRCMLART